MFSRSRSVGPVMCRCYTQIKGGSNPAGRSSGAGAPPPTTKVTGLSSNCVKPSSSPVGPGASASGGYKVPEYFSFNRFSFAEAEVEMAKFRCPQPSALTK
ncbi:uncharacterized protein DMAD_00559 [Drosophila madeirensis]|uniref:NADH dehydrogenase [ubiquinone] flavoprotein 3, mitochondrial n=1 Tax=Drosophila madeirensis TaxID=30013 RepID=A0AAU9FZC2_DROMD|nr:uncharacterized protein LOC117903093 [Drosophila subobscura]